MANKRQSEQFVGLKDLRENLEHYINKVKKGEEFTVFRRSKPIFKVAPVGEDEGAWETVVDFTKIRKGGVDIDEILKRL